MVCFCLCPNLTAEREFQSFSGCSWPLQLVLPAMQGHQDKPLGFLEQQWQGGAHSMSSVNDEKLPEQGNWITVHKWQQILMFFLFLMGGLIFLLLFIFRDKSFHYYKLLIKCSNFQAGICLFNILNFHICSFWLLCFKNIQHIKSVF